MFFSEDEIDYVRQNVEYMSFSDICRILRGKIRIRTGRSWSNSMILKEIRKIISDRKKYVLSKSYTPEIDMEKIKKIEINRL